MFNGSSHIGLTHQRFDRVVTLFHPPSQEWRTTNEMKQKHGTGIPSHCTIPAGPTGWKS